MLPIQRSDVLALALSTYTTTTTTTTASLSPSAASSFGSCKNTFMASPPCRVSLSVSTSHILTACQKYCHRNGTERNGAELNSTQLNRTEPKCTALHCHLAITRARIKDAGIQGGWDAGRAAAQGRVGGWSNFTMSCKEFPEMGVQPTQIKSRNGPVTNLVDM